MRVDRLSILKFIDHWVGGPICIGLVLLYRLTHPFYKTRMTVPPEDLPPRSVLIMKFVGIGSIQLSSSIIKDVRQKYNGTRIYFMTFKSNEEILEITGLTDRVLIIDTSDLFSLVQSITRAIVFCQREKITVSMDIEFYSKFSTMMSFLCGAKWRMGFYLGRFWRNSLVNIPINFNYSRHILEIYAMFSKALGIERPCLAPQVITVSAQEKSALLEALKDCGLLDLKDTVAINIHASDLALARRWPLQHFASLVDMVFKEYPGTKIILTGVKAELAYSQGFIDSLPSLHREKVVDLTGRLSLKQFLALLSMVPLFVTNDSGPFHLANALGARTISLWGPSSVTVHGLMGMEKNQEDYIYKRFPCSPCIYIYRTNAGYFCQGKAPCMEEIQPQEVMALIRKKWH